MPEKTCFVIMAIGDQSTEAGIVSSSELRSKYDDLIKEAILRARPKLDVARADDNPMPGTITTDIVTRIMHSDYVVADVTYPNPNVFHELGLRHACRAGTVIIKDREAPRVPFDIAHLRYIEYENTGSGLKELASQLEKYFDFLDRDPHRPDNHFQELAKLTSYEFPKYNKEEASSPEIDMMMALMNSPALLDIFARQAAGEDVDQVEIFRLVASNPTVARPILETLVKAGTISFAGEAQLPPNSIEASEAKGFGGSQKNTPAKRRK